MEPLGVVKALDGHKYGTLEFPLVTKTPPVQLLFLEKFEEGLHNRIIVQAARCRERLHDVALIQKASKLKASKLLQGILRSPVRMKQHRLRLPPFEMRLFHRVHYELCVRFAADTPRNDFSRKKIQNNANVMKPFIRADIGDIARPDAIRLLRIELLFKDVPARGAVLLRMSVRKRWFFCRHSGQLHSPHQAVHSSHADLYAIFRLEATTHFMSTEPFVRAGVKTENLPADILIFEGPGCGRTEKMLVVRTPIDSKYPAQGLDGMLVSEFMDGL